MEKNIIKKDTLVSMICGVVSGFVQENGHVNKSNHQFLAKRIAGDLNGYLRQVSTDDIKNQATKDELERLKKENKKLKQQCANHSGQIQYFLELLEDNGISLEDL